MFCRIFMP